MAVAVVKSRALAGMTAPEVVVEAHLANGLPAFTLNVRSVSSSGAGRWTVDVQKSPALAHLGYDPANRYEIKFK